MTGQRIATVGHTVKVCLAPVEGQVESDRHPEIAGSTQQEAGQQSKRASVKQSDPILAGVAVVRVAEKCCRENCGGPETDAGREGEKPVSTSAELFPQSDKDENKRVDDGPLPDVGAVQCDASEIEDSNDSHGNQQTSDGREAE